MATRIEHFTVTVPAGTLLASPVNIVTAFNDGQVDEIEIRVPPGPVGLMGFQIAYGAQSIVPHDSSQWIVTDNEVINWPLVNFPTGRHWAVNGYNTDINDHTIYLRYLITEIGIAAAAQGTVVISAPPAEIVAASSSDQVPL